MKTVCWSLGLGLLALCLGLGCGCNPPPQLVTVPNVVGQTQAGAGSLLAVAQLVTGTVTQQCDNTVAAGLVISQSPAAATPVSPNSAVNLVISTGPCPVNVPNVVGQTQSAAGTTLGGVGLITGTVTQQCDNTVAAGSVISQNPPAGAPVAPGTPVDLVISSGPCPVTVPNVVGQTQSGAGTTLGGVGLITGTVTQQCDNTVAAGSVISQSPPAGAAALFGGAVNLVISTGPCPVTVPNVVGQTQSGAGTTLGGAGLITGTVTQQCDNTVAAGLVISQSPPAGAAALFGGAVNLVISTGPCPVNVPNVAGQTQAAAAIAITGANLVVGTVAQQCDNTVAAGSVISQNPPAGAPVPPGTPVDLVVSTGPCPVSVPNVVGQATTGGTPLPVAGTTLTTAGLTVGTITYKCSPVDATGLPLYPAGVVMSQSPAAGTPVPPGTPVDLIVSTGPC